MKKTQFLLLTLLMLMSIAGITQQAPQKLVKMTFKNSSWLPKKFSLISYAPGESGNSTYAYWLLPGFSKTITYSVGTKVYVSNQKQVNLVMSGKRIDNDTPFLIVKESDNDKIISLK